MVTTTEPDDEHGQPQPSYSDTGPYEPRSPVNASKVRFRMVAGHGDLHSCCHCGATIRVQFSSAKSPLGKLVCGICLRAACAKCNFSSYILPKIDVNHRPVRISRNPTSGSVYGFICCNETCGWSQCLHMREEPPEGCLTGLKYLFTGNLRPLFLTETADFNEQFCLWCNTRCCYNCIRFKIEASHCLTEEGTVIENFQKISRDPYQPLPLPLPQSNPPRLPLKVNPQTDVEPVISRDPYEPQPQPQSNPPRLPLKVNPQTEVEPVVSRDPDEPRPQPQSKPPRLPLKVKPQTETETKDSVATQSQKYSEKPLPPIPKDDVDKNIAVKSQNSPPSPQDDRKRKLGHRDRGLYIKPIVARPTQDKEATSTTATQPPSENVTRIKRKSVHFADMWTEAGDCGEPQPKRGKTDTDFSPTSPTRYYACLRARAHTATFPQLEYDDPKPLPLTERRNPGQRQSLNLSSATSAHLSSMVPKPLFYRSPPLPPDPQTPPLSHSPSTPSTDAFSNFSSVCLTSLPQASKVLHVPTTPAEPSVLLTYPSAADEEAEIARKAEEVAAKQRGHLSIPVMVQNRGSLPPESLPLRRRGAVKLRREEDRE